MVQANNGGSGSPIYLEVWQNDGMKDVMLASSQIDMDDEVTMDVTALSSSDMQLKMYINDINTGICAQHIIYYEVDQVQGDVITLDCNNDEFDNDYRFGFNGQMKDDEIAGAFDHNTAKFWEFDTRTGRRWNLDPKPIVWISQYATFANNPILYPDVLGDIIRISGTSAFQKKTLAHLQILTRDKLKLNENGEVEIVKAMLILVIPRNNNQDKQTSFSW